MSTQEKILFVDDEPHILAAFRRTFHNRYSMETAPSGEESLKILKEKGPFAVLVADLTMPGMDGLELVRNIHEISSDTVCMMLTGNLEQKAVVDAVNEGHVYRFLNKPISNEILTLSLEAALEHYRLQVAEKELLEKTLSGTIHILTEILATTAPDSFGLAETLRSYVRRLLPVLKTGHPWEMEVAAMLSQVGAIAIPPETLLKARYGRPLIDREKEMLKRIPLIGKRLISKIPRLERIAKIIYYQDKRYDGTGYPPDSVAGREIPPQSRILKILLDLVRLQNKGESLNNALRLMMESSGSYDPVFLGMVSKHLGRDQEAKRKETSIRKISLSELRPGNFLMADVFTSGGTLLVSGRRWVTDSIFERIQNYASTTGVQEPLEVADLDSDVDRRDGTEELSDGDLDI